MKKGFTLIELICVITILGLIALIAIPTINNMINKSREESYDEQLDTIIDAARTYMSANSLELPPQNTGESECVSIKKLKAEGIIEEGNIEEGKIENPCYKSCSGKDDADKTNEFFTGGVEVRWNGEKYTYTYVASCDEEGN